MASTSGQMGGAIKDSGSTIICTVRGCTVGETAECMRESIMMIRSTASVFTPGQTVDNTTECGKRANSTVKENIYCHLGFREEVSGRMVIESGGLTQLPI